MGPRIVQCRQGDDVWDKARLGHATASRFVDIMAGKGQREAYLYELVAERLAGKLRDSGGQAKDWGHEAEDLARGVYMARTGTMVEQVGFARHRTMSWVGASIDGWEVPSRKGGIEIKSPFNSGIHARTLHQGMPRAHDWQTQGNIWIYELDWMKFLSYDPAFNDPDDLYIEHIKRRDGDIKDLQAEVKKFLAEVSVATADIKTRTH